MAKKNLLLMANKIQSARPPRPGFDRNSPLGRFWHWWSGELTALAPQWLRQSGASIASALLIEVTPQSIVLWRWQQGALIEQGHLDLHSGAPAAHSIAFQALFTKLRKHGERVAVLLPEAQCLAKQIELPVAAAENLRQVLGFEMDRHTPFKADQVYFDFRIQRQDNQGNRIFVKLVAAPRHAVDGSLELLARLGAPAQAVYVADATATGDDAINLMPTEHHTSAPSGLRGINLGLLVLVLVLAITAIAIPIWQKRTASMILLPLVDRTKQQAMETDALRRELEKLTAEYNFMLDKKQEIPPLIVLLDELSRLLPDDTWVQQFNLKGKELQIQGETASSSKLIALFETSRILHDANFRSPLTKGYIPNSERYHLAAEIKGAPSATLAVAAPAQPAAQPQPLSPLLEPGKPAQEAQPAPPSGKLDTSRPSQPQPPQAAPSNPPQLPLKASGQNKADEQQKNPPAKDKIPQQNEGGS